MPDYKTAKSQKTQRSGAKKGGLPAAVWRFGRQKFTIMLVPHTEKRTLHFQISLFTMFFLSIVFLGLLAGFFWFSLDFSGKEAQLANQSRYLAETEANLDVIRDEVGQLIVSAGSFRENLDSTMNILGIDTFSSEAAEGGGDMSSIFDLERSDGNAMSEVSDLQTLRTSLDSSVSALENIGTILSSQKDLLSDIPTIWPVKDVRGWVTQAFGPAIHPFGRYWYLHRGVDLAFGYGFPLLASANGKVVKKEYDKNGFGYYIDLQHKYGFKTRYAHMQRQLVDVGQEVAQGDVIGTMGNSGMSTGPHVHYEVMIGTQLVDPLKFLNMIESNESLQKFSTSIQRYR